MPDNIDSEEARQQLVRANLRFVISIAKQYQGNGLPLVDLIQSGNLGMLEASRRYDQDKGVKFISYAVWWVRQSIIKALSDYCRTVRVPMNQIMALGRLSKVSEKFKQKNDREPSSSELSEITHIEQDKVDMALQSVIRTVPIDAPINQDESLTLSDTLPEQPVHDAEYDMDLAKTNSVLEDIIQKLPDRDSDVLRMSFGINMPQLAHEEIGARFGIGSERVRQIVQSGIKYIRKHYMHNLKDFK